MTTEKSTNKRKVTSDQEEDQPLRQQENSFSRIRKTRKKDLVGMKEEEVMVTSIAIKVLSTTTYLVSLSLSIVKGGGRRQAGYDSGNYSVEEDPTTKGK